MIRIELAHKARADLDDIVAYLVREAGRARARRMLLRLRDRIDQLGELPELGPAREDLNGRRVLICRPYIAIYRLRTSGAETLDHFGQRHMDLVRAEATLLEQAMIADEDCVPGGAPFGPTDER